MNTKKVIYSLRNISYITDIIYKGLQKTNIILLKGDIGAGKTTLTKYIVSRLGGNHDDVTSPTFNLAHRYNIKKSYIWHLDLYRIRSSNELINLGIEDALKNSILIIEWGDVIEPYFYGTSYLNIFLFFTNNINIRKIEITLIS